MAVRAVPAAAGGASPSLEASYRLCRRLARRHGRTYFVASLLLPRSKRRHVHALYGFCRHADDIVDQLGPVSLAERRLGLLGLRDRFFADLQAGSSEHPVLQAVVHTARAFDIDEGCFDRFLGSMAMDLSVASYERFEDLLGYMDGSAAVIGEMMLPILEAASPAAQGAARDLGIAFQLTNFIRDVGEDLQRGRVYLPQEDIRRFGAGDALAERRVTAAWRRLLAYEMARARCYYASADRGIGLLPPASARCVSGARVLYAQILDRVEANGYDVFSRRARVPGPVKLGLAARLAVSRRPPDALGQAEQGVGRRRGQVPATHGGLGLRHPGGDEAFDDLDRP